MAQVSLVKLLRKDFPLTSTCDVKDVSQIGSYNWSSDSSSNSPHIIVPGLPDFYRARPARFQLTKDHGAEFSDENHFRQPDFPTEAIFRAVKLCSPNFSFQGVDFVTDRNNLRKLLRFLGTNPRFANEPFKIIFTRKGTTVVFTRVETSDQDSSVLGFGHSFESNLTVKQLKNVTSFRRIIKLSLGSTVLVVRSEVDAVEGNTPVSADEVDDIAAQIGGLKLAEQPYKPDYFPESKLKHTAKGNPKLYNRVLELKTKNANFAHEVDWDDFYFQMLLGGVDKVVMGWHNRGFVSGIDEYDSVKISAKASSRAPLFLGSLEKILRKIKEVAHSLSENKSYVIEYDASVKEQCLVIEEYKGPQIMPEGDSFQIW